MFLGGTRGQTITGPSDATLEQGDTSSLHCNVTGVASPIITWGDATTGEIIFIADGRASTNSKHDNFMVSLGIDSSTMTISIIAVEDEGRYYCASTGGAGASPEAIVKVEGKLQLHETHTRIIVSTLSQTTPSKCMRKHANIEILVLNFN